MTQTNKEAATRADWLPSPSKNYNRKGATRIYEKYIPVGSEVPRYLGSKLTAICFRCSSLGKLIKEAKRGDFWCPACNNALFWERR